MTSPSNVNRSVPAASVIPVLAYPDVVESANWLCRAFGFRIRLRIANHRIQLEYGDGALIVSEAANPVARPSGHSILVRVEDADAHFSKAAAAGARILSSPETYEFGERQYTAEDLAGHVWTFSQSVLDVDPAAWGGVLEPEG
jgi:uncharacterized glyoxalase superfamily protein PhnB